MHRFDRRKTLLTLMQYDAVAAMQGPMSQQWGTAVPTAAGRTSRCTSVAALWPGRCGLSVRLLLLLLLLPHSSNSAVAAVLSSAKAPAGALAELPTAKSAGR